jgi:DNA-binding transcriptional ArsR family regulator
VKNDATEEQLDRIFFALSDRTRRKMLAQLAKGESTVSSLAEPHAMSLPAILKHLGILRDAGLITEEKDGRVRRCRLDPNELERAGEWITYYKKFWKAQFDKLEGLLENIGDDSNGHSLKRKKRSSN